MKKENRNNKNNLSVSLDFVINNLKLEGIKVPSDEILIYKSIMDGKIDIDYYKKAVLA